MYCNVRDAATSGAPTHPVEPDQPTDTSLLFKLNSHFFGFTIWSKSSALGKLASNKMTLVLAELSSLIAIGISHYQLLIVDELLMQSCTCLLIPVVVKLCFLNGIAQKAYLKVVYVLSLLVAIAFLS